jgi:uncharacterized protein (DUF927 family)/phage/plasmid primase-like uncharacterized protein
MQDFITQFREALIARHIVPPEDIVADGKFHRCDAEGEHGRNDASYLLHSDNLPAGGFINFRDGLEWQNWHADPGRKPTAAEWQQVRKQMEAAERAHHADVKREQDEVRKDALSQYETFPPVDNHPYLTAKGVQAADGIRLAPGKRLVIPMRDVEGVLYSLQFIAPNGRKFFLSRGRVKACLFLIGTVVDTVAIAEGYATAASIHEATRLPVAVAFNCGNLVEVARALRDKYPEAHIVLCADDDWKNPDNPGLTKAKEAASACGGVVAVPHFDASRREGDTDFNDMALQVGFEAVKSIIDAALTQPPEPPPENPTRFYYLGGYFELKADGVYFTGKDKEGAEQAPRWLCSPLIVKAKTRDDRNHDWGRLLVFEDDDHVEHQWAMPVELLQGDRIEVWKGLTGQGFHVAPGRNSRDLVAAYIDVHPVTARARSVGKLGWHGGVFVRPDEAIGQSDEMVVFQNAHAQELAIAVRGTVEDWRREIAFFVAGNSRLVAAVCAAFASVLIDIVREESFGFHLRGGSSTGKSTVLRLAASVFGEPARYVRNWRTTANALEGLALVHNDCLLILDEFSQVDPQQAGEVAYLLGNGQGKSRATRAGAARAQAKWQLIYLSAGEQSLAAVAAGCGKRINVGQEIRFADIEADAGKGMGIFENLYGYGNPADFAQALKDASDKYYGAVGRAFQIKVVEERPNLPARIESQVREFVDRVLPEKSSGQAMRVARHFGLLAVAGELATEYGLTGWKEGAAESALASCFVSWLENFGGAGDKEKRDILTHVRGVFEQHGSSRFEDLNAGFDQRIPNRIGFSRRNGDVKEYLVPASSFRTELCQGVSHRTVLKTLLEAGWIIPGHDGHSSQKPRIKGCGTLRCYVFGAEMWEWDG